MWYYTGLKTLIDNGKHHEDNYVVAKILTATNQQIANKYIHFFYDLYSKNVSPVIVGALNLYGKNLEKIINSYNKKQTKNYLILFTRDIRILYTIFQFANIDPLNGKTLEKVIFKKFYITKNYKGNIYFNLGYFDTNSGTLFKQNKKIKINTFVKLILTSKKRYTIIHKYDKNSNFFLIKLHRKLYLIDKKLYKSLFVQLGVLKNYNNKFFKPIFINGYISIYEVR